MSGSAGGGGYEYQASVVAYVGAHILAERPLLWLPNLGAPDIPDAVRAESGGPGDDLHIVLCNGSKVEVQAKHGLKKGPEYWKALLALGRGLKADPLLYGILVVDRTASGTIKDDLRCGLQRLANNGAGPLNETTRDVVTRFANEQIDHPTLFERLSVVIVDVEEGLNDMRLACEVLTRVVDDPNQTGLAWKVLERDGLRLIGLRGQRRAASLARTLTQNSITLSPKASNAAVLAAQHAAWLATITSSFSIPGLGLTLPMKTAWIDLDLAKTETPESDALPSNLEEQLIAYRDQARLAHRREAGTTFGSRYLTLLSNRIVVLGGPGSGKSTLLRHMAHELSLSGHCVLHVRLPQVFKAFNDQGIFQDALLTIATDGAGISLSEARRALARPDCLLADGLDECDHCEVVMREINAWAEGHPTVTIVVATRSFGHTSSLLPNWTHVDALPFDLDNGRLRMHARHLMLAYGLEASQIEEKIDALEYHLQVYDAVSLAARNPLLFCFLVGLSIMNVPLGRTRAELYERVVQYAYQRAERDRDGSITIDESIARYVIDATAWHLMYELSLPLSSLVDRLKKNLAEAMGYRPLRAQKEGHRALSFWQQQGLIETLRWSGNEFITFIHPILGEYTAARYAAEVLDDDQLREWLTEVNRDQQWRQTILLAAGADAVSRIVPTLLMLDASDGEQSVATEAVLAAATLMEVVVPPPDLVEAVIGRLQQRLVSPIPAITFEAATTILGLASYTSSLISRLVQPLLKHDQRWTRLAAARLLLAQGDDAIDLEDLATIMADILDNPDRGARILDLGYRGRWPGGSAWDFQNAVLVDGLNVLITRQLGPSTEAILERAVGSNATSVGSQMALVSLLQRHGYDGLVKRMQARWRGMDRTLLPSHDNFNSHERAILEAVAHTVAPPEVPASIHGVQDLESLPILLGALGWLPEVDHGWLARPEYSDQEAADAVIRGAIAALRLDRQRLSEEVAWALSHLADLQQNHGLLVSLEAPPMIPQWHLAVALDLSLEALARGLMHPSRAIARTAAQLLYQYADDPLVGSLLERVLTEGEDQVLALVAVLAPYVWKESARDVIVARLDGQLTSGCTYLVQALTRLTAPAGDPSTFRVLVRVLNTKDPRLADEAANALAVFDPNDLTDNIPQIEQSLHEWTSSGSPCLMHGIPVFGDTHEGCLLVATSPRAALVRLLARVGYLSNDNLLSLCGDQRSDVRAEAAHALVEHAQDDVGELANLLVKVEAGALPIEVLKNILASRATRLDVVRDKLIHLFHARNIDLRRSMVRALSEVTWLNNVEKLARAKEAIYDEDTLVRDYAADALRTIQSESGES